MDATSIAILTGIISMIGWGVADLFAKKGIDETNDYVALTYVFGFSLIFSLPLLLIDNTIPAFNTTTLRGVAVFGFIDFLGYLLLYKAYSIGKVSALNPITSGYAVVSAVISYLVFGELFTPLKSFSFALVMLGVVLTSVNIYELRDGIDKQDFAKGVPEAFVVFILYGIMFPFWNEFIDSNGWVMISIITKTVSFVCVYLYTKHLRKESLSIRKRKVVFWLLMVGLLEGISVASVNYGLFFSNQTSLVIAISSTYPLVIAVGGYLFLKERLVFNQYVGILLIVGGIVLSSFV